MAPPTAESSVGRARPNKANPGHAATPGGRILLTRRIRATACVSERRHRLRGRRRHPWPVSRSPVHHQGQCGSERRHRSHSPERPHPINLLAWEFFTFPRQHRRRRDLPTCEKERGVDDRALRASTGGEPIVGYTKTDWRASLPIGLAAARIRPLHPMAFRTCDGYEGAGLRRRLACSGASLPRLGPTCLPPSSVPLNRANAS